MAHLYWSARDGTVTCDGEMTRHQHTRPQAAGLAFVQAAGSDSCIGAYFVVEEHAACTSSNHSYGLKTSHRRTHPLTAC